MRGRRRRAAGKTPTDVGAADHDAEFGTEHDCTDHRDEPIILRCLLASPRRQSCAGAWHHRLVSLFLARPIGPGFGDAHAATDGVRASPRQPLRLQRHRHRQLLAVFGKRSMPRPLLGIRGRFGAASIIGCHAPQSLGIKHVTHEITPEVQRGGIARRLTDGPLGLVLAQSAEAFGRSPPVRPNRRIMGQRILSARHHSSSGWQAVEYFPIDLATDPALSSACRAAACRFGASTTPSNQATPPAGVRKSICT
jgi:hypothetical protein